MTKNSTNKGRMSKVIAVFSIVLCLGLCISFAELFSSLITVGGFNAIKNNEIKQASFSLYAISLYQTDTKAKAQDLAEIVQRKNGAGFIWQTDTAFNVLASCYENLADAQKVQENLKASNTTSEIITLNFQEISIKAEVSEQEKNALIGGITSYKNMYKKLYDLSVSIDTNLYTEIEAKVLLSDIISEFSKIQANFETLFNPKLTSSLLELKLSLKNVSNILESLSNFSSSEIPYTSQVKNSYFQILDEYFNLSKTL